MTIALEMPVLNEDRFRMKPFEGGVFVVAVKGGMGDATVFEILHKVDGEETFANAAFAVEDEDESLFHVFGFGSSMKSTSAICGPSNFGFGAGRGGKGGSAAVAAGGADCAGRRPRRLGGGSRNTSRQKCRTVVLLTSMPSRSRRMATMVS
jgi:hypothetical protein